MVERLREQGARDVEKMRAAPQGPVDFYLETSIDTGSDFDRALIAATRLAQEHMQAARAALSDIPDAWFGVLREHVGAEALARTIQPIGDALYFADTSGFRDESALQHVKDVLGRLSS